MTYWRLPTEEAADKGWFTAVTDLRAWVRKEIADEWGHVERQSALEGVERHLDGLIAKFAAKDEAAT